MRSVKSLSAVFLAALSLGVVAAATANASEWLENGNKMTAKSAATTTGIWTLKGIGFFGFVETEVICRGSLIGAVGPGNADEVTEIADLAGHKANNGSSVIDCEVSLSKPGACIGGETAFVAPVNLNLAEKLAWVTKLVTGTSTPKDEFAGSPGFTVTCNGHKESCWGKMLTDELTNTAKGVLGKLLKASSEKCSSSGSSATTSAEGETTLSNGATLSVAN